MARRADPIQIELTPTRIVLHMSAIQASELIHDAGRTGIGRVRDRSIATGDGLYGESWEPVVLHLQYRAYQAWMLRRRR